MSVRPSSLGAALAGVVALVAASSLLRAQPALPQTSLHASAVLGGAARPPAAEPGAENAPPDDADAPLPIPPVPPRIAEGSDYDRCLDMLATDPSGADAMAGTLGGEAAQHCHALAQVELGNTETGAALLDTLAASSTAPESSRAVVFGQAEQAWTMAGRADQAYVSASNGLALSPNDPELRIGHAMAAMALNRFAEAADDLTHALDLDPKRADALILRATAWRNLGKLDLAQADIAQAFALDPGNPDGFLERGILRQRLGDLAGARTDWQQAADLAADTPTGDLAQQNLALLEAGPLQ